MNVVGREQVENNSTLCSKTSSEFNYKLTAVFVTPKTTELHLRDSEINF